MIVILLLVATATLLYYLIYKSSKYWTNKNVPIGNWPFIALDNVPFFIGRESMPEFTQRVYNKVEDARYIGMYLLQVPALLLKSPELIKQMCVKDFDHFLNHRNLVPPGVEELWSKNLFVLKGQAWKNMRSTLSPSFTSSKMRGMFILICHNANLFAQHFVKKNEKIVKVEFKDAYRRYTNDVIASAAFGVQVDSLEDRENEFYLMGESAADFTSPKKKFIMFMYAALPRIAEFLGVPILGEKVSSFFINLVKDTIKLREEKKIKRYDMMGLLLEARKGQHQRHEQEDDNHKDSFAAVKEHLEGRLQTELTDMDIASQAFIFFLAGFETVSSSMCFLAHELAVNPDIQKRLTEEIDANRSKGDTPTYETIMNMTYMDMVVSEGLRKWPIAAILDRVVTKPYTIPPELPNEKPVHLNVNDMLSIPVFALHRDPKYYPDPEKFDPERFSPENRETIIPYTYLPFGVGPRNCIGSRFALLEIKAVFFYLLSHFEIVPVEKTQNPIRIDKRAFTLTSEDLYPLGLKRRH